MTEKQFNKYDVFRSFLVENCTYDGFIELPIIKTSNNLPEKIVTFSTAMKKSYSDFDAWVAFYEYDRFFERFWNNPKRYLAKLKKFKGVISPDFSLYRNMPLVMQMWNTYKGRALAVWLQSNGVEIIPNVRTADERTCSFAFCGIEKNKTVAIGTHGCIKTVEDRQYFRRGLAELVKNLSPKNIIVYGSAPDSIFKIYKDQGINIIPFESEFAVSRKPVTA